MFNKQSQDKMKIHFDKYKMIALSHYVYMKYKQTNKQNKQANKISRCAKDKNIKTQNYKSAKRKYKLL